MALDITELGPDQGALPSILWALAFTPSEIRSPEEFLAENWYDQI